MTASGTATPTSAAASLYNPDPIDLARDAGVVGVVTQEPPAPVLGQEPHPVREVGKVDLPVMVETHGMGIAPAPAYAVVVLAHETGRDGAQRGADIGGVGDDLRHLRPVALHIAVASQ